MNEVRIEKTGQPDVVSTSDGRLTLSVPIQIKRRGGRKVVRLPDGNTLKPRPINDKPTPIQMALARGHRWLAMLESGGGRKPDRGCRARGHGSGVREPDG